MVQGKQETRLVHGYGTREAWSTVSARLWYKGILKHGYGTRETWSTVKVQGKLEARLWYKGNLKQG